MSARYKASGGLAAWATIALALGMGLYVFVLWSPGQGLGMLYPAVLLLSAATLTGLVAWLWALLRAAQDRDVLSTLSFGLLLVVAGFVAYALLQNGHTGDYPLLTTIYGYPPLVLGEHPYAWQASWALFNVVPATVLTYSLLRGRTAQRMVAGTGLALAVATLATIHLAG